MSRSYKRHNIVNDHRAGTTKWFKRQASKKARRMMKLFGIKSNDYKRVYDSYNITDFKYDSTDAKTLRK